MADLMLICADAGFTDVATYIASGNVVLKSSKSAARVRLELETRLRAFADRSIDVFVRTDAEIQAVQAGNPFRDREPARTYAFFLQAQPSSDALQHARGRTTEELRLGRREIYVYYPSGMGRSKLRIEPARHSTARNMNTVSKLVEMCRRK